MIKCTVCELVKEFSKILVNDSILEIDITNNNEYWYYGTLKRFLNKPELIDKYGGFNVTEFHVNEYGTLNIIVK